MESSRLITRRKVLERKTKNQTKSCESANGTTQQLQRTGRHLEASLVPLWLKKPKPLQNSTHFSYGVQGGVGKKRLTERHISYLTGIKWLNVWSLPMYKNDFVSM